METFLAPLLVKSDSDALLQLPFSKSSCDLEMPVKGLFVL